MPLGSSSAAPVTKPGPKTSPISRRSRAARFAAELLMSGAGLHGKAPRRLRQGRDLLRHFGRLGMACSAVDHPFLDALHDPGVAEEIVGEIPVEPVRHRDARPLGVTNDDLFG